ncbi:2-succinyl-5-enolpyruvyl-6-hydroxy-3-cyclohexene-1-carboxylate synthase [Paramicrobacterium humi]|uniref:2-succinyl-5-enolpyruvyl-6-hydroxy-3-cyclohexene-1-carboxylate synthase n=1 Tax=Paramicrobacterium humi TaxID=640635 RepID=A0A1H4JML3_9MICO|nr:2-succinyl-5-enolpyruvyl-6-hydroxy-3-cyclohexene-1-carboxylic-acid synthase [Microbacterium humi]SEB47564.1 2-succinyl-5-enolpyruvyl-6-hydroxy-3-cyclohexene-1-carboxylate synthase [Microbacterium humi]
MPEGTSPATAASLALLSELTARGLRDVVVSPGSRSQALALAAAALETAGALTVHVRIDERSAAFFALGLAVETGVPAAVITTSGTAVANLHPAVLEAHHSMVPLILLTGDRPSELRGIRSNQTTRQPGMFASAVRLERDVEAPTGSAADVRRARDLAAEAMAAAAGDSLSGAGPVHLNLAFREPLSSALPPVEIERALGEATSSRSTESDAAPATPARRPRVLLERGPRTVVIAGHAAGPAAEELAHAGGWPLLAEVTSGSRYGRNLVVPYRVLLREPELGGRIERAIVFGHPTLSREVPALLQREDVEVVVVAPHGDDVYDPGRTARAVSAASVAEGAADRAWLGAWIVAARELLAAADLDAAPSLEDGHSHDPEARLRFAKTEFEAVRAPVDRARLVDAVWRATWPHDRLVLAASRLIREADTRVLGKKIRVHANRGLAGIDGTIATAHGMATASQRESDIGVTRVLLGDLALLHDVGSLLGGHDEPWPRLQLIVGNDRGGTIFDGLEVAASADRTAFDRVQYTPHDVDIAALATAYHWDHVRAVTRIQLDQALTSPRDRPVIIEVPLER